MLSITAATLQAQAISAILEPALQIALKPSVTGRVAEISVKEGDQITDGALVAQLDARIQKARLSLAEQAAAAEGPIDRAAIVVEQAKTRLERIQQARKKGAAQPWEVRAAEQTLALAQADARVTQEQNAQLLAQLDLERETLLAFSLTAPFDGTVLQVLVDPGEIVGPDTPIIEIGELTRLKATAFLPVRTAAELIVGEAVEVKVLQNPALDAQAFITAIDPRVDPASQSVRVTLEFNNLQRKLSPGTAVQWTAD